MSGLRTSKGDDSVTLTVTMPAREMDALRHRAVSVLRTLPLEALLALMVHGSDLAAAIAGVTPQAGRALNQLAAAEVARRWPEVTEDFLQSLGTASMLHMRGAVDPTVYDRMVSDRAAVVWYRAAAGDSIAALQVDTIRTALQTGAVGLTDMWDDWGEEGEDD